MGAVQLYTHLSVGCNSRFSLTSACQLYGLESPTGLNTLLLLDAAPIPVFLSVAPTALDFVATPRTHSLTSTSFDRVIYSIHPLHDDAGAECNISSSADQWAAIDIRAPDTVADAILLFIAMTLIVFKLLLGPDGGSSMLDALLQIISRDRVTDTPPHVSVCQQEDRGNGPVLDDGMDLGDAPNVALPDDDDNDFYSIEAQSYIALDNFLEPYTIVTTPDDVLWLDLVIASLVALRLASSPPADIPSECACETAVSDDCTTEDIDFEGRISIENGQADDNGSIAGHNSETLPGTPCDNSALLDSTSLLPLPLPTSSSVSAHIPRTDIPETVVDTKGRNAASVETSFSAHSPISPPLPPLRMRSRSLSTPSSAHSPESSPLPPLHMRPRSLSTSAADNSDGCCTEFSVCLTFCSSSRALAVDRQPWYRSSGKVFLSF
ncbi:uncharacterized protein STEHIDRAFT_154592 [Stereum hirsutum FP-91666 SS1]|uniref:uncharacterized protein n=1 Tax=Stereum hirsutum (strain FP-91666) TaxID=721885 RepID=UPI000440FBE5|nr:uncharacterized protein STEHIDRAFT_154592 [Stereum hirsutum FP-91666 SS1]EIM88876.1 hypothetical protein STEHIDRAFT_154592 [Stereum hirsutum FP-91666 SS1]